VGANHVGAAQHAIPFAYRLALIVCVIIAHLRPVFYTVTAKCGLSRIFSFAIAKIVWRALAALSSVVVAWPLRSSLHFDPLCLQI
jgi:hypothetical protein